MEASGLSTTIFPLVGISTTYDGGGVVGGFGGFVGVMRHGGIR
jgi:hypothetical protein